MDLTYRPTNGQPVLTEHRVVAVSPPDKDGTYHQDWAMTFTAAGGDVVFERTPLPGEPGGQPWGGYAGLSVRFAKEIKDARAITPQGPVEFADGRYRGKAAAMDYTGVFEGREAGIAILDSAANLNSPSPWYAINDSTMRYFSPAVIQDGPHTLKSRPELYVALPGGGASRSLERGAVARGGEPLRFNANLQPLQNANESSLMKTSIVQPSTSTRTPMTRRRFLAATAAVSAFTSCPATSSAPTRLLPAKSSTSPASASAAWAPATSKTSAPRTSSPCATWTTITPPKPSRNIPGAKSLDRLPRDAR